MPPRDLDSYRCHVKPKFKKWVKPRHSLSDLKDRLEIAQLIFSLLYKAVLVVGLILVASYCFHIGFFPKGLSVGDTILFIFTVLGSVFLDVIVVLFGAVSTYWIAVSLAFSHNYVVNVKARKALSRGSQYPIVQLLPYDWAKGFFWFFVSLFVFLMFALSALAAYIKNPESANTINLLRLMVSVAASGFVLSLLAPFKLVSPENKSIISEKEHFRRIIWTIVIAFFIPLMMGNASYMIEKAMSFVGVRVEGGAVSLSEENYKTVVDTFLKFKVPMKECKSESETHIVYGLDILWHRVGSIAHVRSKMDEKKSITFDLNDDGIKPFEAVGFECELKQGLGPDQKSP